MWATLAFFKNLPNVNKSPKGQKFTKFGHPVSESQVSLSEWREK
jgi:hypothetical protein